MTKGLFISGVDTGVGKTVVAGGIAAVLRKRGMSVGVMKPAESGAKPVGGKLVPQDALFLKKMAQCDDPIELINPYCFKKPLSPYHAAIKEGVEIDIDKILAAYRELAARHDIVIVEGAGGLFAPLTKDIHMGDLASLLNIPLIIVSHPYLGTINHTLLTAEAADTLGLKIAGIVFNQFKKNKFPEPDFDFIHEKSGSHVLGLIEYLENMADSKKLISHIKSSIDIDLLLERLKSFSPESKHDDYEKRDKEFVWHPFTQMKEWLAGPVVTIDSGRGALVRDIEGKEYLDAFSSYWCNVHGHRDLRMNKSMRKQLNKIAHSTFLGLSNTVAVDLAEKLVSITPAGLEKVFYSDDGSTAIEVGLKMAFQYWRNIDPKSKRTKFLAVDNAYHGDTVGSMSVGGSNVFFGKFRDMFMDVEFTPAPYCYRCPIGKTYPQCSIACADIIDEKLKANEGQVAAMIIEPLVQCPAGIITAPHGYLKRASELCAKHDVLLIADEVAVGFGRTGKMFACDHEGVTPDIMAVSKSITGGMLPLAATLATQKVFDAFLGERHEGKTFYHGHTYTANQLGCAVAVENLKLYEERNIIGQIQEKGAALSDMLVRYEDLENVGNIRQRGLIAGVELVKNRDTKEPYASASRVGAKVASEAMSKGLLIRPLGDILVLFLAPAASVEQIGKMTDILYESINAVTERA